MCQGQPCAARSSRRGCYTWICWRGGVYASTRSPNRSVAWRAARRAKQGSLLRAQCAPCHCTGRQQPTPGEATPSLQSHGNRSQAASMGEAKAGAGPSPGRARPSQARPCGLLSGSTAGAAHAHWRKRGMAKCASRRWGRARPNAGKSRQHPKVFPGCPPP